MRSKRANMLVDAIPKHARKRWRSIVSACQPEPFIGVMPQDALNCKGGLLIFVRRPLSIRRRTLKAGMRRESHEKTSVYYPIKLEEIKEALSSAGVRGMTVSEVRGFRRNHGHTIEFVPNVPKLKLEIVVAKENIDKVVETVKQAAAG